MSEIILCNQPLKAEFLSRTCSIDAELLHGKSCSKPNALSAFTPYVLGQGLTAFDRQLISTLSTPEVANQLTNLSLSFGGDNTAALAEITKKLQDLNIGLMGASTSVYANRLNGFAKAVKDYQDALMGYRDAIKSNSATKGMAKQKALNAFRELQFRFRLELNTVNTGINARRGTPLTSGTRATNIARSSRNVAKLNITSQVQANNLVKFTKHTKLLGNGLAVIDFTSRIGNIHNEYQSGGEWERELFIESSSFAVSALAGTAAVNAGSAALGLLVAATPVGWIGLVVGGIAVAGVAAATSMGVNSYAKNNSGNLYDDIMNWVSKW